MLELIDIPMMAERWLGVAGSPRAANGGALPRAPPAELGRAFSTPLSPDIFEGADLDAVQALARSVRMRAAGAVYNCSACWPAAMST